jgi:hypothetical protein
MTLLAIVVALALEQWRAFEWRTRLERAYVAYVRSIEQWLNGGTLGQGIVATELAIAPPGLVAWLAWWIADGHAHGDVGRINERDNEIAGSVHDHRAMAAVVALPACHRIDPFDPRLFHVAEVDGVVDVAEHVHVAPAQLLQRRVNQHALFAQGSSGVRNRSRHYN